MTKVGTGFTNGRDSFQSGQRAAEAALRSGAISRPDFTLAFCAGSLDAQAFHAGVRAALGVGPPILGGSAIGVLTNEQLSYTGHPAAVAVLQSDTLRFSVAHAGGLQENAMAAAGTLARALPRGAADALLLAFYDSVLTPAGPASPPLLHSSAPLLSGFEPVFGERFPVVGAGLLGGYDFGPTWQFCGDSVQQEHVVGCLVSGAVTPYVAVMHGCIPLDGVYHRITAMEKDVLYELDGRPLPAMLDELFGGTDWRSQHPLTSLTLGVNCGERFGTPREAAHVNRLITGLTADGRGVGMFEPDLGVGAEVQFMLRDNERMFASVRSGVGELLARIEFAGKRPVFALYVDCGGRTSLQSSTEHEEAALVQELLCGVPLFGFYSGVELAPMMGRNRGLDWTGVLLVLAEEGRDGQ